MSFNSFGHLFRFTSWGESHGPAIGCVVDGCPPNIALDVSDIQPFLDARRPGSGKYVSQRRETDQAQILSGIYEGKTTGTPISILIENKDQRSKDYRDISDKFRPGHADYTYQKKYGLRDPRGGGRSSARETAMRVAAGAIARKALSQLLPKLKIVGALVQMGNIKIDEKKWSDEEITRNPFFCPDADSVESWQDALTKIRKSGDTVGAVVEIQARNPPVGLGTPIYRKLDAELAAAMMSINAVKAVEIGLGMSAGSALGSTNADEMRARNGNITFSSNNAGGILGGISSGQDIMLRFAVKPAASILMPKKTIDSAGANTEISTKGRHDPCVGIRAVPVGEAMMACVLLDQFLLHRAQTGA